MKIIQKILVFTTIELCIPFLLLHAGIIIQLSDDLNSDHNPAIIIDHTNRIWFFWESNRNGTWDIYARYFEEEKWSPLMVVTCDTFSNGQFDINIDACDNLWLTWVATTNPDFLPFYYDEFILAKFYDGVSWSKTDTIAMNGRYPAISADIEQRLWVFWSDYHHGDILTRYYHENLWKDIIVVLKHLELSVQYEHYYYGPIKATQSPYTNPWFVCREKGWHHGGYYWDFIHAVFRKDTSWVDIKAASGNQNSDNPNPSSVFQHDIGSDASGKIYVAYSYRDTSKIISYLKSYEGTQGEVLRKWELGEGQDFSLSDGSEKLGVAWSFEGKIYAKNLNDTIWTKPELISDDLTIVDNQHPVITIDNFDNYWIAWQGEKNDNKDIFVSVLSCTVFTPVKGEASDWLNMSLPSYSLFQNFPNPFNSQTIIRYQIPQSYDNNYVVLKIYDINGKEVITLVNEQQPAGNYRIVWDGMNTQVRPVSSGVYFYQLDAGPFVEVKKMALIR